MLLLNPLSLESYDDTTPDVCVVDSAGVVGSNLTIDVALDSVGNAIPRIGYYSNSCVRPKLAYLVDTTTANPEGAVEEELGGIGFQNRRMFIEYGHVQGKCLSENNTLRNPHERICRNYKRWHMLPEK